MASPPVHVVANAVRPPSEMDANPLATASPLARRRYLCRRRRAPTDVVFPATQRFLKALSCATSPAHHLPLEHVLEEAREGGHAGNDLQARDVGQGVAVRLPLAPRDPCEGGDPDRAWMGGACGPLREIGGRALSRRLRGLRERPSRTWADGEDARRSRLGRRAARIAIDRGICGK